MSGRKWIFIRGFTRGQGHWGDFLELFAERYPEDEVQCLDLAGNGERYREMSFSDNRLAALDLRKKSRWLDSGVKVNLFGHSLGAMTAVEWMNVFPQDLNEVYLMNTSHRKSGMPWERFQLQNIAVVGQMMRTKDARDRERHVLTMIANNQERVEKFLPEMAKYTATHPVSLINTGLQLLAATKCEFPPKPNVPTHIICSRGDRLAAVENSLKIAKMWGVDPQVHDWAGHDIAIDDPQWLLEQLK